MPPKKQQKKKKEEKDKLPEVDKTFYELQIADLNRKLTRLKATNLELKETNEELSATSKALDEDRCDVIEYLKRVAKQKVNDTDDMEQRMIALQRLRESEAEGYKKSVEDSKSEFKTMEERLTAEIKLLNGKLNSLEEFRVMKEDLTKKFQLQQEQIEQDEVRHKEQLYELEKKFNIEKDNLKKQMESKMLKLSNDFYEATELTLPDMTKRVIRENITINNELTKLLKSQSELSEENKNMKNQRRMLQTEIKLHVEEKCKLLQKFNVQNSAIKQLTLKCEEQEKLLNKANKTEKNLEDSQDILKQTEDKLQESSKKINELEEKLTILTKEKNYIVQRIKHEQIEKLKLCDIILHATKSVKTAIELKDESPHLDSAVEITTRQNFLADLLKLLKTAKEPKWQRIRPGEESVRPGVAYDFGDLGFVQTETKIETPVTFERYQSAAGRKFRLDSQVIGTLVTDPVLMRARKSKAELEGLGIDFQEFVTKEDFEDDWSPSSFED